MQEAGDELRTGIPNEHLLPHLHVITFRRNYSLNYNKVLKQGEATDTLVKIE